MADNLDIKDGAGGAKKLASQEIATNVHALKKIIYGPLGSRSAATSVSVALSAEDVAKISALSYTSGAIISASAGSSWGTYANQACRSLDIVNTTGTDIEYRRGGAGLSIKIPNDSAREILGITNANQISVRRVDLVGTTVSVTAEWLS